MGVGYGFPTAPVVREPCDARTQGVVAPSRGVPDWRASSVKVFVASDKQQHKAPVCAQCNWNHTRAKAKAQQRANSRRLASAAHDTCARVLLPSRAQCISGALASHLPNRRSCSHRGARAAAAPAAVPRVASGFLRHLEEGRRTSLARAAPAGQEASRGGVRWLRLLCASPCARGGDGLLSRGPRWRHLGTRGGRGGRSVRMCGAVHLPAGRGGGGCVHHIRRHRPRMWHTASGLAVLPRRPRGGWTGSCRGGPTCALRRWSSGRIVPCHGTDPGSIPGRRIFWRFLGEGGERSVPAWMRPPRCPNTLLVCQPIQERCCLPTTPALNVGVTICEV